MRATSFLAAVVLTSVSLTACSGDEKDPGEKKAASCAPTKGAGVVAVRDDKGALPAGNVVSVTSAKGDYRKPLEAVDRVTRAISSADVAAVAGAGEKKRSDVIKSVLSDLVGKPGASVTVRLSVDGQAETVAALYRAGLAKGSTVEVVGSADKALAKLGANQVALVSLSGLATATGAEVTGQDLNAQLQSVATAALAKKWAVGATGELAAGATVWVATHVAAQNVTTVAQLVDVCGEVTIAHTTADADVAAALAEEYGVGTTEVTDPVAAIADGTAVAAVS